MAKAKRAQQRIVAPRSPAALALTLRRGAGQGTHKTRVRDEAHGWARRAKHGGKKGLLPRENPESTDTAALRLGVQRWLERALLTEQREQLDEHLRAGRTSRSFRYDPSPSLLEAARALRAGEYRKVQALRDAVYFEQPYRRQVANPRIRSEAQFIYAGAFRKARGSGDRATAARRAAHMLGHPAPFRVGDTVEPASPRAFLQRRAYTVRRVLSSGEVLLDGREHPVDADLLRKVGAPRAAANPRGPRAAAQGLRPVPNHIARTPRSAATRLSAVGIPGTWPIGDLYHARLAAIYAKAPAHRNVRAQVMNAVERAYPGYDWVEFMGRAAQPTSARARTNRKKR